MTTATAKHESTTVHSTTKGRAKATTKVRVKHIKQQAETIKQTATDPETKHFAQQVEDWCNEMIGGDDSDDDSDDDGL